MTSPLTDKSVLITGGTGSFGHTFAKHCLNAGAARVVIFSRDELKQAEMAQRIPDPRLRFFVGDVRDPERLERAMQNVDLVVHAAAMKRIETCEANPEEAVRTNVLGTLNVAKACVDTGVEKAVFLSTDKAPNAATLYGATKFCAERLWCQSNVYAAGTSTRLSATRYGNVIGSRGSVLSLFRTQYAQGEPLTLTDEGMTRFWMSIQDAVHLVVLALNTMRGGEVFVPKAGSCTLLEFARAVVENAGEKYPPGHIVTGLRATERLHETLIAADESGRTRDAGSHFVIEPESRSWGDPLPPVGLPVPAGFEYRSDTNPVRLDLEELQEMMETC